MAPKARRSTSKRTATVTKPKQKAAARRPVIKVKFAGQNVSSAADEDAPPGQNAVNDGETNEAAADNNEAVAENEAAAENNEVAAQKQAKVTDENEATAEKTEVSAEKQAKVSAENQAKAPAENDTGAEKKLSAAETNISAAETNMSAAETNVSAAETNVSAAETNVSAAETNVSAAETNVSAAETNISAAEKNESTAEKQAKVTAKDETTTEKNGSAAAKKAELDEWEAQVKTEATAKFNQIQEKKKSEKSYDYLLSQVVRFTGRNKPLRQETRTQTAAWSYLDSSFSFRRFQDNAEFLAEAYGKRKGWKTMLCILCERRSWIVVPARVARRGISVPAPRGFLSRWGCTMHANGRRWRE
jgi:hypothetical protein